MVEQSKYSREIKNAEGVLWSKGQPKLGHLDIELTERCNNACIHCYINQPLNDKTIQAREMSTEFIFDILQQAANLGCLSVRLTGGEPLVREDFKEIYLFARRLGLRVLLFTNARLISDEMGELFSRIPPGMPISITVYGMHANSYDAVAASPGAFDEFWHGIGVLLRLNIPFEVKQSLLPQNRDELAEFEAFAASIPGMKGQNPSYAMNFDLRARRDNPAKNRFIRSLRLSPSETLAMLTRDPQKYIKTMREFTGKFMGPPGDRLFTCGAGLGACVDAYGNAQMCMLLRHPKTIYPLDRQKHYKQNPSTDLSPLEFSLTEYFPQIRQMRAANPDYLKRCAVCFLKGLCEQCPAKSWEEHGTLDTPVEYLCEVAHLQAEYLGLLNKGEKSWTVPEEVYKARLDKFVHSVGD